MIFKVVPASLLLLFLFFAIVSGDCEIAKGGKSIPKPEAIVKDIPISKDFCARLYVPKSVASDQKLPLVVFYRGGGFMIYSAFYEPHDDYVYSLIKEANVVALSVDYRRAWQVGVPGCLEDSWVALKWVASHSNGHGPEELLNNHVDFTRVSLAGESAGANIAHNMVRNIGLKGLDGLNINGIALIHPYFWGNKRIGDLEPWDPVKRNETAKAWLLSHMDLDDPRINPLMDPKLSSLRCKRILVMVAEQDEEFRDRDLYYYKALRRSGWKGKLELMRTPGKHAFHLYNSTTSQYAISMLKKVSSFVNKA